MEDDSGLSFAQQWRTATYLQMTTTAIIVYDWLVLFDREVEYIWKKEWNVAKMLYIFSRYGPFLDAPIGVVLYIYPYGGVSYKTCDTLNKVVVWSTVLGVAISESILVLRTNALYLGSRWVTIPLSTVYVLASVGGIVTAQIFLRSARFGQPPNDMIPGCFLAEGNPIIFYTYLMLLIVEIAVISLTLRKGYRDFRSGTPLVRVLYRDSVAFFLILFCSTLFPILTLLLAPTPHSRFLSASIRVTHSIICSRIILNLRQAAASAEGFPATLSNGLMFVGIPSQRTSQTDATLLETVGAHNENGNLERQADGDFAVGRGVA